MNFFSKRVTLCLLAFALVIFAFLRCSYLEGHPNKEREPDRKMLKLARDLVEVQVTPAFNFSFARMKKGVLQHLDRSYTYDVIPEELENGLLFQGIHRPPAGTGVRFELQAEADVYFFFHDQVNGGYPAIFEKLPEWTLSSHFPQYDIHNGNHGLTMVMYHLKAGKGRYHIPPTTSDRACFNIVFVPQSPIESFDK